CVFGFAALPQGREVSTRRQLCRANLEDVLRQSDLWPSLLAVAGRRQWVLSARRGVGTDTRSPVTLGDAMGRTLVDAHEFQSRTKGVQGGAPLGAGHRDD